MGLSGAALRLLALGVVTLQILACDTTADFGLPQEEAVLKREAEEGDPAAQTALAQLYEAGSEEVERDPQAARRWYERAASRGYVPAQYFLGQMFEQGSGMPVDHAQAAASYLRAAEQGDPAAQAALGRLYELGRGVPRDYDRAAEWYRRAATAWEERHGGIAVLPRSGSAVPVSDEEATKWMRRAAELGVAQAQYDLGQAYEEGLGVTRNLELAAKWYESAALRSHAPAAEALARLGPELGFNMNGAAEAPVALVPESRGETQAATELPYSALTDEYRLHLASYRTIEEADAGWRRLLQEHGNLLEGLQVEIARVDLGDRGIFWRVQAGPLASAEAARDTCAEFERRDTYCQVVAP